jgi:hypothetical protein
MFMVAIHLPEVKRFEENQHKNNGRRHYHGRVKDVIVALE